jgi:hypothetical protein
MKATLLFVMLLFASPVFAQSRVYTNADLGKPLTWTESVETPAEAAAILAPHQFVYLEPSRGPYVVGIYSSATAGPFGEFPAYTPAARLDASSYFEMPWSLTTYVPRGSGGGRSAGSARGDTRAGGSSRRR